MRLHLATTRQYRQRTGMAQMACSHPPGSVHGTLCKSRTRLPSGMFRCSSALVSISSNNLRGRALVLKLGPNYLPRTPATNTARNSCRAEESFDSDYLTMAFRPGEQILITGNGRLDFILGGTQTLVLGDLDPIPVRECSFNLVTSLKACHGCAVDTPALRCSSEQPGSLLQLCKAQDKM